MKPAEVVKRCKAAMAALAELYATDRVEADRIRQSLTAQLVQFNLGFVPSQLATAVANVKYPEEG